MSVNNKWLQKQVRREERRTRKGDYKNRKT